MSIRQIQARIVSVAFLALAAGCTDDPPASPSAPAAPTPPPPIAAAATEPETNLAVVASLTGSPQVRVSGSSDWRPLVEGQRLGADDALRTPGNATVALKVKDLRVNVHERSEFKVSSLTRTVLRAKVRGRIDSDVPQGTGTIEVEAEGSDAVVRSSGGHFAMTSDGRGVVAVATVSGGVNLSARGRSVEVKAGQVGRVKPNAAPDPPSAALRRVLLSVDWPNQKLTNRRQLPVAGRVEIGSRVLVQGRPVEVGADGRFNAEVALEDGKQKVSVTVVDVLGRKRQSNTTIEVDEKAPTVTLKEKPW